MVQVLLQIVKQASGPQGYELAKISLSVEEDESALDNAQSAENRLS